MSDLTLERSKPGPAGTAFPGRVVGMVLAAVVVAGLAFYYLQPHLIERPAEPPFKVEGQHVEIQKDSPTWGYIEVGEAKLQAALAAEPVPGRVAFDEAFAVPIVAPLAGRVDTVSVRIGDPIVAGARLLTVRSPAFVDLRQQIEVLRASEAARRKTLERVRSLVELKAAPEKDQLAAELELNQVRLEREGAELKLRSSPIEDGGNGSYWLVSPRDGAVVERKVLVGEEVGPERSEPLLVVAQLDEVIIAADVPEHDVAWIHVGDTAQVFSPATPEDTIQGKVEYVSEVVDPVRRMVNVRVRVANPGHRLRPNAYVQASFSPGDRQSLVVPAQAVVTDDQHAFVFVEASNNPRRLERRMVAVGRQREGQVEIVQGLKPGERIVTQGAILLLNAVSLAE